MSDVNEEQAFQCAAERFQSGDLAGAEAICREILASNPRSAAALVRLGFLAHRRGDYPAAADWFSKARALDPRDAHVHFNLGAALQQMESTDEAIACFRESIALLPQLAAAHNNLGLLLRRSGQIAQAIASYRQAIAAQPDFVQAWNNLGLALKDSGQLDAAAVALRRALALRPGDADVHNNLAAVLVQQGDNRAALDCVNAVLQLQPDHILAHLHRAEALRNLGELDAAVDEYQRTIALQSDLVLAHMGLGSCLKDRGELDEAIACYRRALAIDPNSLSAYQCLLVSLHYHPGFGAEAIYQEHLQFAKRFEQPLREIQRPHRNDCLLNRRLRIGYVSPDWCNHPIGRAMLIPLSAHDRAQFEITCYSTSLRPVDAITTALQKRSDRWSNLNGLSDEQAAERIREDGIDILVDLAMHTADNRILIFVRKPAPVQLTWLGYPGTTGLRSIDYRLSDRYLDPSEEIEEFYTERSIRLAHCFWCYQSISEAPIVNTLPALDNGFVTFGCLNNFAKASEPALRLWAQVLNSVADSRFILLCPRGSARQRVQTFFEKNGVSAQRLEMVDRLSQESYFRLHHRIDIALDPLPYPGHTTSLDALWMGVPLITLSGATAAARGGTSILTNLGLSGFVARSEHQYVAIAKNVASDFDALSQLRPTLRDRLQRSPLMHAGRFTADLEEVYRRLWIEWCTRDST